MALPWWMSGVVYQIYPRSFADSDGDGVGDLTGIRDRLDHLAWLGVDAVWISPFFRSPMRDFGYDVADYCDVDPLFGDLAIFDELVARAHGMGIRVILDLVPNHSSDQHPWFQAARSSRDNPYRDWYVWRDPRPDGGPPNNWRAAFTNGPAWTFDEPTGQWYLHQFLPGQPDLNWANPAVEEAMHDVMRFWLRRDVDGFRVDVVHCIGGKGGELADDAPPWSDIPHCVSHEHPDTHAHIRRMRKLLDAWGGDKVLIGETALPKTSWVVPYYGEGDELHLAFNFSVLYAPWDAGRWRERVQRVIDLLDPLGAWPAWVLSNHDLPRHCSRYGASVERAKAAAFLLLGLRGTPFLYAGEELALQNAVIPPERAVDPGGRDGCRAPIPWTPSAGHGWATEPWLPFPPDAAAASVQSQRADPGSTLHLYRRLLAARARSPALSTGDFEWLEAPEHVLAWARHGAGGDVRRLAVNFGRDAARVHLDGVVEVASTGEGEGEPFRGWLPGDAAVLVR